VRDGVETDVLLDDELVPHLVEVAPLAEEVDLDGVAALVVTIANLMMTTRQSRVRRAGRDGALCCAQRRSGGGGGDARGEAGGCHR
jgi:hypothetical protein